MRRSSQAILALSLVLVLSLVPLIGGALSVAESTTLISKGPGPAYLGGNEDSFHAAISGDGTKVAFTSEATDLIDGVTITGGDGSIENVYVWDALTDTTVLVTVGDEGGSGNGDSFRPSISEDGTWVSFSSFATNLKGAPESVQNCNIYLWNAETGDCKLISHNPDGTYADGYCDYSSINADGTRIAYQSSANTLSLTSLSGWYDNIFLWEAEADDSILISARPNGTQADSSSYEPSISADGNKIAYLSFATDLIADLTLSTPEWNSNIYVWDASAPTKLITAGTSGTG
ncbi:MAG: hypothetical protein FWD41_03475, partial [Actinomycetia bacterium]|nr:hypothetical protein [Actinomycetes bacterium]